MKNVIVTGGSGFIGKAVCRKLLNEGVKVFAIVRHPETMLDFRADSNFTSVKGDLENILLLEEVLKGREYDVFYHFAWEGSSGDCLKDVSIQAKNIRYTGDTLELAVRVGCKKYIFAGTINELELMPFYHAETFEPRAASIYGITKLACDFICKTIATQKNICYNTAIIGSCFGPGDRSWRIHNTFIAGMLDGIPPKLVSGDVWHDWVYIDDVVEMFFMIGEESIDRRNYYLGHRKLRQLRDILYEVRDILCPELDLRFGEIKDSFRIDYSLVDLDAVYEDTGYECKSDFKEAILKTAEWVKNLNRMEKEG